MLDTFRGTRTLALSLVRTTVAVAPCATNELPGSPGWCASPLRPPCSGGSTNAANRVYFIQSAMTGFIVSVLSYRTASPPMVRIELGRVCVRRRATSLTLSVARWVHNSARWPRFPRPPYICRTARISQVWFEALASRPGAFPSPRGSSADAHTPRLRRVCSQLSSISCVRLRSARCPTTAALKMRTTKCPESLWPDVGVTSIRET